MRFLSALVRASLATPVLSLPLSPRQGEEPLCMTAPEMDEIIEAYRLIIAEYTEEVAAKYLSKDFVDISQSINAFIHQPLDGPTFPTKEVFMEVQSWNQHFPIEILSVDARDCDAVALQWVASFGEANLPSKGITIMKMVVEEGMWKILSIEVEFNALTWLLNMGGSYTWEGKTWTPQNPDPSLLGESPEAVVDEVEAEFELEG